MTTATAAPAASPSSQNPLASALTAPEAWAVLARQALSPPTAEDCWDWCTRHLRMPEGGRFDPARSRIWRRWIRIAQARLTGRDLPGDPWAHRTEQIYLAACTQASKTSTLLQLLAWIMRHRPARAAYYHARLKDLADARRTRLQRMVETSPQLERLLPRGEEARERALGGDTWTVGTTLLWWLNGNVPEDLRGRSIEVILADEIETWAASLPPYGDPLQLALDRGRTFPRSKLLIGISSPGTIHGHTWSRVCTGSHERLLVLCPDCAGADWLDPRRIVAAAGRDLLQIATSEIRDQRLARWVCRHCGALHPAAAVKRMADDAIEADRWCPGRWAIDADHPAGHWEPAADCDSAGRLRSIPPPATTIRSAQVGALYLSDLVTLDDLAATWAAASQATAATRTATINSDWAEPSLEVIVTATTTDIAQKAQPAAPYRAGRLDHPVHCLITFFDQQGNTRDEYWWPWVTRGINLGGESWFVAAGEARTEAERDAVAATLWPINGQQRAADLVGMDSANGNARWDIYLWAARNPARHLLVRGDARLADGIPWREVIDAPGERRRSPKPAGVREWRIAAHHWRTHVWERLSRTAGPGWWLPSDCPEFHLRSLTSEEQVLERRRIPDRGWADVVVWRPRVIQQGDRQTERRDNHWWDCEANIAALASILRLDQLPAAPTATANTPRPAHAQAPVALLDRRRSSLLRRR